MNTAVTNYAFLGPVGTFCHQALLQVAPADAQVIPCAGERLAMDMVREGKVERAVVPIENSIEGGVSATLDSLGWDKRLQIVAEMIVPVGFTLAVREGTQLSDITRIGTHSHAWAQCRNWVADHLPGAVHVATTSTAESARMLSEGNAGFQAVLASAAAVTTYGLTPLYEDVADNPGAVTRFVEVANPGHVPQPCGADKTTIQVRLPNDYRSGALLEMLQQFSARGINLSRIESRPLAGHPGRYVFSIDLDGHVREERVQSALRGLYRISEDLRFLGSYARADQVRNDHAPRTGDGDFQRARGWVDSILQK